MKTLIKPRRGTTPEFYKLDRFLNRYHLKICCSCKRQKTHSCFGKSVDCWDGYTSRCMDCSQPWHETLDWMKEL